MTEFTLSGLPVGNTEQFDLEALVQLSGAFTIAAKLDTPLLSAQASANMSGQLSFPIAAVQLLSSSTTILGGVAFATRVVGQRDAFGLVGGGFIDVISGVQSGPMGFVPLVAFSQLSGSFTIQASISGLLSAGTDFQDHGLNHESFIGLGDGGLGLLSAAASANMTGEPDPLKDGGSPPFVAFDGVDQYLSITDVTDSDLRGGANFSCVVVFDPEYLNNAGSGVLVGKHDPGSTEHGWKVEWDDTTGEITVTVNSLATGVGAATRTTAVGTGGIRVRTVFVFTWDSTALELYVAGASSQGAQGGGTGSMVAGAGQFAIGAEDTLTTAASLYRGAVHAVHIFDDALSSGEVATIDQGGYVPPALIDVNLVASWRPDRIEGSVTNIALTKWRDEEGARHLVNNNQTTCFTGILDHLRWFADDWTMDFINDNPSGLGLDQNLSSNYALSVSTTNLVENGSFRIFNPPTEQTEPEISTGFRNQKSDITVLVGFRIDEAGGSLSTVLVELFGLRVVYVSATQELFVFQGETGTPTEYDFGSGNDFLEAAVPDGPVTVMVLRYNSQSDQFTLFLNGQKKFEIATSANGTASTTTGLRMCGEEGASGGADWGAINPSSPQSDKRAARVFSACLPDLLIQQVLDGFVPDVRSVDNQFFSPTSMRAFLRRTPDPSLVFGQIVDVDYSIVREVESIPPSPPPSRNSFAFGSGTIEILGLPNDGESVTVDDGAGNVETFEFDNNASIIPGNIIVAIGISVNQTLLNFTTALGTTSLRLSTGVPVVSAPDGLNEVGYVRLIQDDLADGDLPLSIVIAGAHAPNTQLRTTGPYRVRGPEGTLELLGQPSDGDQFIVNDRINPSVTFEFESGGGVAVGAVAVTIGGTVVLTLDNLVTAVNGATLALTARATVSVDQTGDGTADAAYTRLVHSRSSDIGDFANRVDAITQITANVSGNLAAGGIAQPARFEEGIQQVTTPDMRSAEIPVGVFIDSPYEVLEAEEDDTGGGIVPPFINPNPVITSVTADLTKTVSAVATAGPTDAGDVQSWWEVEIVAGDPQFNFRIDVQDNNFSVLKTQADTFPVPAGLNFDERRIRFVIQSQVDPDQLWFSLYVRMEGENFDNGDTTVIILPGTGAPEQPPSIELFLSLQEQAFVLDEDVAGVQQRLTLSNRSRYKLTRVFVNRRTAPRLPGRNEDGLEFGLLTPLEDFLFLGTEIRTHKVASGDIGFLDRISVRFYGAGFEDFWWVIAYANGIADPDEEMFVGQSLVIPPRERITAFLARKPVPGGI